MKALPATSRPNRAKLVVARRPDKDADLAKQFSHALLNLCTTAMSARGGLRIPLYRLERLVCAPWPPWGNVEPRPLGRAAASMRPAVAFTDYYGQQSCTAGRAAFITGQNPIRTGLTKVGMPGADVGLSAEDPTIAELLKPLGYKTGQFGKNHLGEKDQFLPTMHGFDEFFGNLYHLNAEEEPEDSDYPKEPEFKKRFGPRGVLHCRADGKGGQTVKAICP